MRPCWDFRHLELFEGTELAGFRGSRGKSPKGRILWSCPETFDIWGDLEARLKLYEAHVWQFTVQNESGVRGNGDRA